MVGVGMTEFHCVQFMPLEINHISFELLSDHDRVRDLVRKRSLPNPIKNLWGGMLTHDFHNVRLRYCFSIWKALKKSSDSKPMISMAMCNIDGRQVLATRCNPICQFICLLDGHKGVN